MNKLLDDGMVDIDGTQYPKNHPSITIDVFTGKYIHIQKSMKLIKSFQATKAEGLVRILEYVYTMDYDAGEHRDNTFFLRSAQGNFNIIKNYKNLGNGILHPSIIEEDEGYILFDDIMNKKMNNAKRFRSFNNIVKVFKDYDNSSISDEDKEELLTRDIEFGVRTLTNKIFEGLNYTFGIELETNSGRVSEKESEDLNLKCEFDGSLRDNPNQNKDEVLGGEYITGVLIGDAGMKQLNKVCSVLSKNCTINSKCGVHVHIGSLKFNKENIVYMYMLGKILENDIFNIMPKSRRNNSYCRQLKDLGLRAKNLNKNIPITYDIQIDEYFDLIFKEVSGGKIADKKTNKLYNHPYGSKCGYNKDSQRYCWLNFVTAMFNTKQSLDAYTLEFRIHYATLNYTKIKNWLKICVAFVNFAENHQSSIKRGYWMNKAGDRFPIDLYTIIKASYPRSGKLLEEYIDERRNKFLLDNGNIEELEYSKDKEGMINLNIKECVS